MVNISLLQWAMEPLFGKQGSTAGNVPKALAALLLHLGLVDQHGSLVLMHFTALYCCFSYIFTLYLSNMLVAFTIALFQNQWCFHGDVSPTNALIHIYMKTGRLKPR